jgi:uncharacterized protein (DUF58 family)
MRRFKINFKALGVYLFGLCIVYLTSMSMSGVLLYLFFIYLFFPVFSLLLFFISYFNFRYFEHFSTEHPVKGDEVKYKLSLASESNISGLFIDVKFKLISPLLSMHLNDINTVLKPKEIYSREYKIKYPYRGIYKVGIEYLKIHDVLNWIWIYPLVWFRTFHVYPRLIEIGSFFPDLQNMVEAAGFGQGIMYDHTLFKDLQEYRAGQSLKHMAWKKFATTGEPILKSYEKTSRPGVEIYLDMRREKEADHKILEREDCSVEILVSLAKYFLANFVPTNIHAFNGRDRFDFFGTNESYFKEFYKSTINLSFAGDHSPANIFKVDMHDKVIKTGTIIFITHVFDPEVLELVLNTINSDVSIFAIINQSGMSSAEKQKHTVYSSSLADLSRNIIFVESTEALRESMKI